MSRIINKEKLCAGIIFGDTETDEYLYMPGGEIGSPYPICILDRNGVKEDINLDQAAEEIVRLHLRPLDLEPFSKL